MTMIPFSRFCDYFIAVADTGSLRKAAEQCFISSSAIHRQILLAEESFNVTLFERLPTGLKLTLAGEMLYSDIKRWQKEMTRTCRQFDEIQGLKRGTIEFGLIAALADGMIIDSLIALQQQYPWINVNIQLQDSQQIAKRIIDNELDFGLVLEPHHHSQLEILSFVEIPLGLALAPEHPLAMQSNILLSDTLSFRHIMPAAPLMIHDRVLSIYKSQQLFPEQTIGCNDIRLINALLQRQVGIALVSFLDIYPAVLQKRLTFQAIHKKGLQPITLALCTAPRRQISSATQIFIRIIMTYFEQLRQAIANL